MRSAQPTLAPRPDEAPALALRAKDAAKALGISERLLWTWTNCGRVPHLRIGTAVVYPVEQLRAWLASEAAKGARR